MLKSDPNLLYDIDKKQYVHEEYRGEYIIYDTEKKSTTNFFNCRFRECLIDSEMALTTLTYAKNYLKLDPSSGIYYNKQKPNISRSILYNNIQYTYERSKHIFSKFKENPVASKLAKLNEKYSFGVELETSTGVIPSNELLASGLIPVRDGSTPNYEYVTVPLNNIDSLFPIIESVNKHCKFNITTSLHIHVGNVPTDKTFISNFYRFMKNIQDDVFAMFPKYKSDNIKGIKRLNYTQKLPNKVRFNTILNFLNNNTPCDDEYFGQRLDHYADRDRNRKWELRSRYYWVNLIPLIFYPSRTIEFRIHQGTFNKYKIIYWLLMIIAFIKYVEAYKNPAYVSIETILTKIYGQGKISEALCEHYKDMCSYYTNYDEDNDPQYRQDEIFDKEYKPKIKLF